MPKKTSSKDIIVKKAKTRKKIDVKRRTKTISRSTSYISLLYGALTLLVVFSLIFLAIQFLSKKKPSSGVISDRAAMTARISPDSLTQAAGKADVTKETLTQKVKSAPTVAANMSTTVKPVASRIPAQQNQQPQKGKKYTVVAGDNLWMIAQKIYNSGYNWVTIAQANKIPDPNQIYVGSQLLIPEASPIVPPINKNSTSQEKKILPPVPTQSQPNAAGSFYVVRKGDNLWNIAVSVYGNGYRWKDIARENNLANPSLIHSGNRLKILR